MAINKAMKAALKVLSFPDPDIKKSYKVVRGAEKISARSMIIPRSCKVRNAVVTREGYDIPVRIFSPASRGGRGEALGVVLFFHGGGWVNGDVDSYTGVCVNTMLELSRIIVAVDYRRSPEFKFPTAPEDCYAVAKSLFSGELIPGIAPEDIIIMGDSAGGNLAAVISHMARDRGEFMPRRQILIYPSTASDHSPDSPFESVRENGTDYLLTSKRVVGYMELYASCEDDFQNPYLAPLLSKSFAGLPDTLIITAQYCPLRDEGEEYGRRMREAGAKVSVYRMPDVIHGFFTLPLSFKAVRRAYTVIRRWMRDDKPAQSRYASWLPLDNAAKIFPPTTTRRDGKVFRFYCQLTEPVDGAVLSQALEQTLAMFPFYRSVLKKGIFWYYFEESALPAVVVPEHKEPCAGIFNINRKSLLFEVTYFGRRINFEVYHALSDGEGAVNFFRTLVTYYLKRKHPGRLGELAVSAGDASAAEKKDDSFFRYYKKQGVPVKYRLRPAYRIKGERLEEHPLGIIEGRMSVAALLELAHRYNVTLTAFLVSQLICAMYEGMPLRDRSKTVVINVPVDLRQYFSSKTARNFFGVINIGYDFSRGSADFEEVLKHVSSVMKRKLTEESVGERMSSLSRLENLLPARMVPVVVKDPGLRIAAWLTARGVTASFSNLGRITMPEQVADDIERIGVMCSTGTLHACMCSCGDSFVISFSSPYASSDIQCRFFRALTEAGVEAEITSNLGRDGNVIL